MATITTGTEKQIAWAEKIAAETVAHWSERLAHWEGRRPSEGQAAMVAIYRAAINHAATVADAGAWIDARSTGNRATFVGLVSGHEMFRDGGLADTLGLDKARVREADKF